MTLPMAALVLMGRSHLYLLAIAGVCEQRA
jgi:hypothetical protein